MSKARVIQMGFGEGWLIGGTSWQNFSEPDGCIPARAQAGSAQGVRCVVCLSKDRQ